jgi:hypothetical protein
MDLPNDFRYNGENRGCKFPEQDIRDNYFWGGQDKGGYSMGQFCKWPQYDCNMWLYYGAFSIDNCIVAATWPHNNKYNSWRVTDCSKEGARTRKYWFLCEFPNAAGK